MQNGYIESFMGRFRCECLNENAFTILANAPAVITARRRDYCEVKPHNSCGRMQAAQLAAMHRQLAGDASPTSRPFTIDQIG